MRNKKYMHANAKACDNNWPSIPNPNVFIDIGIGGKTPITPGVINIKSIVGIRIFAGFSINCAKLKRIAEPRTISIVIVITNKIFKKVELQ